MNKGDHTLVILLWEPIRVFDWNTLTITYLLARTRPDVSLLAFIMLLQAKDPFECSADSIISPLGNNLALNTLKSKDVLQCIILQNCLPSVDAKNFQHRIGHVPIREKAEYGPDLCVWGMLSPKLYTKCGRPLDGWWCISL